MASDASEAQALHGRSRHATASSCHRRCPFPSPRSDTTPGRVCHAIACEPNAHFQKPHQFVSTRRESKAPLIRMEECYEYVARIFLELRKLSE